MPSDTEMSRGQYLVEQALQLLETSKQPKVKVRDKELMVPKGGPSVLDAQGQHSLKENPGNSNDQVNGIAVENTEDMLILGTTGNDNGINISQDFSSDTEDQQTSDMVQQALQLLETSEHLKVNLRDREFMGPKVGQSVLDEQGQKTVEINPVPGNKQDKEIVVEDMEDMVIIGTRGKDNGVKHSRDFISDTDDLESSGSDFVPAESESSTTDNEETLLSEGRPSRGRKRKHPNQSRKDRKKRSDRNEKHFNCRGQKVAPKEFNAAFHCCCKRKCTHIVPVEERRRAFNQFWKAGSFSGRCGIINIHVIEVEKKRTYTKNKTSKRSKTRKYYFGKTEVCKIAFLKTLQINQNRVDVALQKRKNMDVISDLRGTKSGGKNKHSEEKVKEVVQHIDSFPRYVSHYCRADTDAKFLSEDLNLSTMYELYKSTCNDPVSLSSYKFLFYSKFNLRFKSPKKDTCLKCDTYMTLSKTYEGDNLLDLNRLHEAHLQAAKDLRCEMNKNLKDAQTSKEVETLTFDLQKTHPLPKLPTNILYCKRQLNVYNLGIHVGSTGKGIFNVWLEHEAGRGTQEIGSCLMKYIKENIQPPTKKLILWCDSCGGQNRSIRLVLLLIYTLQNHVSMESITMRFLLSGHSFLPNDSEFGDVECALKIQQRLYTDTDYMNVMKSCRKKKKFTVNRLNKDDMYSVSTLEAVITNRKIDVNRQKVSWLSTHEIHLKKEEPTMLYMKQSIAQEDPQKVNITNNRKGRRASLQGVQLHHLWPNGKELSKEKIKDLKDVLKLVPKDAQSFYNFLKNVQQGNFVDDIEGFGNDMSFGNGDDIGDAETYTSAE